MKPKPSIHTTSPKQAVVENTLRKQIVSGKLQPGDKLPTWDELEHKFSVSRTTVMRAIENLRSDGFVIGTRKRGTFVTDYPPHLFQIGLLFMGHPDSTTEWSTFYDRLLRASTIIEESSGIRFKRYYRLVPTHPDRHELARINDDLTNHRLAGLVATYNPSSDLIKENLIPHDLPRIAINYHVGVSGFSCIYPDIEGFRAEAIRQLAQRGRKRVAIITSTGYPPNDPVIRQYQSEIEAAGMQTTPELIFSVSFNHLPWARIVTRLFMQLPADKRPDAMIILDDNLTPAVLDGLREVQCKMPDDMLVVTLVNYPNDDPKIHGVIRIGVDMTGLLREIVHRIGLLKAKSPVPALSFYPYQAPEFD
jgi:DNA-binding transcriptional MocR family regulator